MKRCMLLVLVLTVFSAGAATADPKADVFKGKLFPPNVILENQAALGLSKDQLQGIRAEVVTVQAKVAEHEWDMREAYQNVMADLDKAPIDEDRVLKEVGAALSAENEVKKLQVRMLVRLKNLLSEEQIAYLESHGN